MNYKVTNICRRNEVWIAKIPAAEEGSSVQSGTRTVVVLQNNLGNSVSPTTIVAPTTTRIKKVSQPTHVVVKSSTYNGLTKDSMVELEQIMTINQNQLIVLLGKIENPYVNKINRSIAKSLDMV